MDGVGARLGRSSGYFMLQGLLIQFASLEACVPAVLILVTGFSALWIRSVKMTGQQFEKRQA